MRICERCGTPNDDSARFCDNCGTILPDPAPPGPPPAGQGAGTPGGGDAPTRIEPAPGGTAPAGPPHGGPPQPVPPPAGYGAPQAPPPAGYGAPQAPPPAYGPAGPAPTPFYGPPAAPPPAPPGQPPAGWQGPPAMRPPPPAPPKGRSATLAIVAGIVAFLVVGAAGAGAYFALKDDEPGKTSSEAGTTATSGTEEVNADTTTDGTTDTTSSKPDKPATFRVNVCGRLSPARRCGAPGFNRSGNVKRFYIWLAVLNAPKGKAVRILLTDANTGKNILSPTRYVTSGAKKDVFTLRVGGGPFGRLRAAIRIKYKRDIIRFKPPLRLNLR